MLYKNAHDRTIFIFLNVTIFLKVGCINSDAALILLLLPYSLNFFQQQYVHKSTKKICKQYVFWKINKRIWKKG